MTCLQISLFGPWQLRLAGKAVPRFPTVKTQALLAYLAVEAQVPHTREALIGLFWADYAAESGRQNLRKTLQRLRQMIPAAFLLTTTQTVQFDPRSHYQLDVTTFIRLLNDCRRHRHAERATCPACMERLQQAVALYQGEFLAHFFVEESPAFEEWLLLKREWLRREALNALAELATYHERRGEYDHAYDYAWRQVELDPLREEAHRQIMRSLAYTGQRSEALAQYATCRRLLADDLNVEPAPTTVQLYKEICAGTLEPRSGWQGEKCYTYVPPLVDKAAFAPYPTPALQYG